MRAISTLCLSLGLGLGVFATTGCGGGSGANSPTTTGASNPVRVAIASDGTTTFDGKKVDGTELTNRAREASRAQPQLSVVIDAEREVSFQNLMSAVEKMRAAGVQNIALGSILGSSANAAASANPKAAAVGMAGPATGPTPEPKANVAVGTKWDCPFPPPNERGNKEEAKVLVVVHVDADNKPLSVDVLEDPGAGFGAAAKKCALEKAYQAPKDVNGRPVRATTYPFYINFVLK